MLIMTAKVSRRKILAVLLVLALAAGVLALCMRGAQEAQPPQTAEQAGAAGSNDARVAFLEGFGWQVQPEPVQTQQVLVPEDPSEVFLRYNDLQISQGYDLLPLSGKSVMRYVYQITNYPGSDGVYFATLLVYDDAVVGGDVASSRKNGVMHGLAMPAGKAPAAATGGAPETDTLS